MKSFLFLIFCAMAFAEPCLSRTLLIDPLLFPVLITHEKGAGSGCFLQLSNSVYLVTARHVLFSEPEGTNPPVLLSSTAVIKSFSSAGTTNVTERNFILDLTQLMSFGEVRYSTNGDIALVRIEDCDPTNRNLVTLLPGVMLGNPFVGLQPMSSSMVCVLTNVDVGADVYMFGYPMSLTAPIRNKFDLAQPLLRKGIVAGVSLSKRTIVVDSPSYQGNSGGPVIQVEHPEFGATDYKIIGVVSAFVPFEEEWENKTLRYSHVTVSNSGYTLVEPIDSALELVWK
ncbi:MAG: serine protease [Verrucomicrobiota bacterium]|jgi:hypothetical protein